MLITGQSGWGKIKAEYSRDEVLALSGEQLGAMGLRLFDVYSAGKTSLCRIMTGIEKETDVYISLFLFFDLL